MPEIPVEPKEGWKFPVKVIEYLPLMEKTGQQSKNRSTFPVEKPVMIEKSGQEIGSFFWNMLLVFSVYTMAGMGLMIVIVALGATWHAQLLWLGVITGILGILVEGRIFND